MDDDSEDSIDEELVTEQIEEFGIAFTRPEHWDFRVEDHPERPTYLYWDEDAGSLRITPWRPPASFVMTQFLDTTFADEQASGHDPSWQTIGPHRFLAWVKDGESRSHFFMTGRDDLVIVCSYAYAPEWLDDEVIALAVEAGLDDTHAALASLTF